MNSRTIQPVRNSAAGLDAAAVLLRDLIDYAGLFPPASLSMSAAVTNYHAYLQSEWKSILGRLIVPIARLDEFEAAFAALPSAIDEPATALTNWRLSFLLGSDPAADLVRLRQFSNDWKTRTLGSGSGTVVDSVELKVANAEEIPRLSSLIPADIATYFEVPLACFPDCIAALATCGRRAKIRTGGETADKFPASATVIEFIRLCATAHTPFKATAGLHHPIRSAHRFTYQADSASGIMHGFLNLFLAAAFLRQGMPNEQALPLLEEQSAEAFHFDSDGAGWRQHRLSRDDIADSRRTFALSFGSCSFTEPIDDLRSLRLL